jgi:hypothetical protein
MKTMRIRMVPASTSSSSMQGERTFERTGAACKEPVRMPRPRRAWVRRERVQAEYRGRTR